MFLILMAILSTQQTATSAASTENKLDKYSTILKNKIQLLDGSDQMASQISLAESYFLLGQLSTSNESKRENFLMGEKVAEDFLKKTPDSKEMKLLWIANKGEIAGIDKNLKSLFAIPSLESELLKMVKIAPEFAHASAHRALGKIYLYAPIIISVGSKKKAEKHIQQAFLSDPEWPENRMAYAELLLASNKASEAAKILSDQAFLQKLNKDENLQTYLWQQEYNKLDARIQSELASQ